jgi:hypothetical protein
MGAQETGGKEGEIEMYYWKRESCVLERENALPSKKFGDG